MSGCPGWWIVNPSRPSARATVKRSPFENWSLSSPSDELSNASVSGQPRRYVFLLTEVPDSQLPSAGSMNEDSLLNREYGFGFDSLFRNLVPHVHFQPVDAWL